MKLSSMDDGYYSSSSKKSPASTKLGTKRYQGNKDRCKAGGKRRYRDVSQAKKRLRTTKNIAVFEMDAFGHTKRSEVRIYFCESCNGYHLTSQKSPTAGLKNRK